MTSLNKIIEEIETLNNDIPIGKIKDILEKNLVINYCEYCCSGIVGSKTAKTCSLECRKGYRKILGGEYYKKNREKIIKRQIAYYKKKYKPVNKFYLNDKYN